MKSIFSSRRFLQKILFVFFAFFATFSVKAQVKTGFEHKSNCLQSSFSSFGIDSACESVAWFIGNSTTPVSKQDHFNYTFSKSGTYTVCMSVYNICKRYDTLYCKSITVKDCNQCEWGNVSIGHSIKNDLCGKVIFEATAQKDTCIKTEYYFDGKWYAGRIFDHQFKANGRYKYGFRYKNHCTGCDTSIYNWVEIGCFSDSTKTCNWSRLKIAYHGTSGTGEDDCRKYVFQVQGVEDTCNIYKMKVVHQNTNIYQEMGQTHNYKFEKDGYYNVCFWAKNECMSCDTWICETVYINCNSAQTQSWEKTIIAPAPNPVENLLKLNNSIPLHVEIRSVLGTVVWANFVGPKAEIDLGLLPNQTYILQAWDELGNRYTQKLIKN